MSTCLVFVLRPGQSLTKVSYRPLQAFPPISWQGTITPPPGDEDAAAQEEEAGIALTRPTSLHLGSLEVATPVVLAPMAGITNAAYRRLCSEQGAGLYVCEMITSRGLVEGDATTRQMLVFDEHEQVALGAALRHRPGVRRQGDRDPVRRVRRRRTSTSTSAARCRR